MDDQRLRIQFLGGVTELSLFLHSTQTGSGSLPLIQWAPSPQYFSLDLKQTENKVDSSHSSTGKVKNAISTTHLLHIFMI